MSKFEETMWRELHRKPNPETEPHWQAARLRREQAETILAAHQAEVVEALTELMFGTKEDNPGRVPVFTSDELYIRYQQRLARLRQLAQGEGGTEQGHKERSGYE